MRVSSSSLEPSCLVFVPLKPFKIPQKNSSDLRALMDDLASPTKRRKTSNEEGANEVISPIQSDIWFDDGSVILQAESTQFRVHRTILARHSSVFRDIFDVPRPHDESLIEGCPIIRLSDSAEDIRLALIALYDGWVLIS